MLFHIVVRAQLLAHPAEEKIPDLLRLGAGTVVDALLPQHIAPACNRVSPLIRQQSAQQIGDAVFRGQRYHVGRRALQHDHVFCILRHRREQGHGGGPGANDDDFLVTVVQVRRPFLRVHNLAAVVFQPGKFGSVTLPVAVVAGTHVEKISRELHRLTGIAALGGHRPGGIFGRPLRPLRQVPVADMTVHTVLLGGFVNVAEYGRSVGDGLGVIPGFEVEAQGMHIAVGADARVLKQVPGAAHLFAPFQDQVALARALGL